MYKTLILLAVILLNSCGAKMSSTSPQDLKRTGWLLKEIVTSGKKEKTSDKVRAHIIFTSTNTINGVAACNNFTGTYNAEEQSKIAIKVGGVTRKICEPEVQKVEDKFLAHIENVQTLLIKKDKLYLYIEDDKYMLFTKLDNIDEGGHYGETH
jgi:heat shock protein HslJ